MKAKITVFMMVALVVMLMPVMSNADFPGRHPAYSRAVADLRHARWELERRGGRDAQIKWDARVAMKEIDACINDVMNAAYQDDKNIRFDEKVDDKGLDRESPFHNAVRLMRRAYSNLGKAEENPSARALRDRALGHLGNAIRFAEHAIFDAEHPL